MMIPSLIVVAAMVGMLGVAAYWIFVSIPKIQVSRLRYKLWKLRDEIVDRVLSGELPDSSEVRGAVEGVEETIRCAPTLTPFNFLVMLWALWDTGLRSQVKEAWSERNRKLPEPEASELEPYQRRLGKAMLFHVALGSPSGWASCAIFAIVMFVTGQILQLRSKAFVIAEILAILKLPARLCSDQSQSLATCV